MITDRFSDFCLLTGFTLSRPIELVSRPIMFLIRLYKFIYIVCSRQLSFVYLQRDENE